jgi:MFS family permease
VQKGTSVKRSRVAGGPLRQSNFRRFYLGYSTSLLGTGMAPVGIASAVLNSGDTAADLGYVLTAGTVMMLACLLMGGVIADRVGRRTVMLGSDALRCVGQGTFGALVILGHPSLWSLIVLAGVTGAGTGLFNPGLMALTTEIVDESDLSDANVQLGLAKNIGVMAGPAIAGGLVAATNAGVVVAIDAATYAVSVVALASLRISSVDAGERPNMLADLREGWEAWRSRSWIWISDAKIALFNLFVYAPLLVLGPSIAKTRLGGATSWGLVLAAQGTGAVVAGLVLIGRSPRRPLLVGTIAQAGWALPLAGLAVVLPVPLLAAAAFVAGAGSATFVALWLTALQRNVPPRLLARVSSYDFASAYALGPIGLLLVGPIAAHLGTAKVLWFAALWQLLSTALIAGLPQIRRLTQAAAPPTLSATTPLLPHPHTGGDQALGECRRAVRLDP